MSNPNLMLCAYCGRRYPHDSDSFPVPHYAECAACVKKRTCKHDTVDEEWVKFRRRFRSYRERCLDCDARRCREPGRWRMGRWSAWA